MNETFMATITVTDLRTGMVHNLTRQFNFYPNAFVTDRMHQVFRHNGHVLAGAVVACRIQGETEMSDFPRCSPESDTAILWVVKPNMPYNDEQSYTRDQMGARATITVKILD